MKRRSTQWFVITEKAPTRRRAFSVIVKSSGTFGNIRFKFYYSPGCGQEERCRQDNHKHCPIRVSKSWYILPDRDRGMSEPDNIQYYFSPVIISKYNILIEKRYLLVTRRLTMFYASNSNTRVTIRKLLHKKIK